MENTSKEKLIEAEIRKWSADVLEEKSEVFNNLPPCPYARAAWDKEKVISLYIILFLLLMISMI